jgi:hypothetical protein
MGQHYVKKAWQCKNARVFKLQNKKDCMGRSVLKVCFGLHSDTYVKMNSQMSKGDGWKSIL